MISGDVYLNFIRDNLKFKVLFYLCSLLKLKNLNLDFL